MLTFIEKLIKATNGLYGEITFREDDNSEWKVTIDKGDILTEIPEKKWVRFEHLCRTVELEEESK